MSDLTKKLWFAYITALAVWGLLAFVELGKYQMRGTLLAANIDGHPYVNDFCNLYSAAKLARICAEGNQVEVYDVKVQEASVREITKPVVAELPFYFQYPPYAFVFAYPLSFLPTLGAWLSWDLVGLGLSCLALWIVARESLDTPFRRVFAMVAFLASFPCWLSVWLGQPGLFACAGLTGFYLCLLSRRPYLAAVCTVPLMVKIQYLPVVGLIGTIALGLPYALTTAAILVGLIGVAALLIGLPNVMAFPHALFLETSAAVSGVAAEAMQNLRGQLTLLIPQADLIKTISMVAYLVATAWIVYMWFSLRREKLLIQRTAITYAASMTTLLMLMTSVHTHRQDYILVVAPCIWLHVMHSRFDSDSARAKWARRLIVSFPLISWAFYIIQSLLNLPMVRLNFIQPFLWWALALFVLSYLNLRPHACALPKSKETRSEPEAS